MRTGRVVGILAVGLAGSAMGQSFSILDGYSDMQVQRLITFDNLVAGQVLTEGDLIEAGVTFGFSGIGENFEALVIDQGGGDLALQMTIDPSALVNASAIGLVLDAQYSAVVATWQRASGSNNFQGENGLGNPGITVYDDMLMSITGASQSPPPNLIPYDESAYTRGFGSSNGGLFSGVRFSISSAGSDSTWIIDDVALGVIPTPGAAAVFGIAGLGLARRRR